MTSLQAGLRRALITSIALTTFSSFAFANTDGSLERWHKRIADGYNALASHSGAFDSAARSYCDQPTTESKTTLQQHWRSAFDAWQAVRFVDFGPVEQNTLAWQFQFWPDPKNLVGRKASQLLKSEATPDTSLVAASGVAVQGFPMAEYLLFDQQFNNGDQALPADRTCHLLTAVTDHISANSNLLATDWEKFQPAYLGNEEYRATTLLAAMAFMDILVDRRLGEPMGLRGNGRRSVYSADAWRSGYSLAAIEAGVRGLKSYFLPGLFNWLESVNETALASRIATRTDRVLARLERLPDAMSPLLEDESFSDLQGLHVDMSQLRQLINGEAAAVLGVIRGFNSSDGD